LGGGKIGITSGTSTDSTGAVGNPFSDIEPCIFFPFLTPVWKTANPSGFFPSNCDAAESVVTVDPR